MILVVIGCLLLVVIGCLLLVVIGCLLLVVIGCLLLVVIGCLLVVIGCLWLWVRVVFSQNYYLCFHQQIIHESEFKRLKYREIYFILAANSVLK